MRIVKNLEDKLLNNSLNEQIRGIMDLKRGKWGKYMDKKK